MGLGDNLLVTQRQMLERIGSGHFTPVVVSPFDKGRALEAFFRLEVKMRSDFPAQKNTVL